MARPGRSRRLPPEQALLQVSDARHRLPQILGTGQLVILGLGVMIGAGIFTLAGQQAALNAGPAVVISFCAAALVCFGAALSYAELSSTLPVAGSAYTFTYVAFGELWGWLVGWALILELVLAAAVVARAWSAYLVATFDGFDVELPARLVDVSQFDQGLNLVAPALLVLLTVLLVTGTRLSARVLAVVVTAKVAVILVVIAAGFRYLDTANYTPVVPTSQPATGDPTVLAELVGGQETFGIAGVFAATAVITFAYVGFDLIATAAEDARDPRRSVPRAMLVALALVTLLYVAMAVVLVGLRPYTELNSGAPVSDALAAVGVTWAASTVNVGGLLAFTTVIMVVLIAQSRVLFAMGRDGLLPRVFGRVSHRFSAPSSAALLAGIAAIALSLYPGIGSLDQLLVLGALFAFFFCAIGVLVLRRSRPDLERGFRVPLSPLVPLLSGAATIWLGLNLTTETWRNFGIWMLVGLVFYGIYGRRRSTLATQPAVADGTPDADETLVTAPSVPESRAPGRHRAGGG